MVERSGECVTDTDRDQDRDGVPDLEDNCPMVANAEQLDCDLDGLGDACDEENQCGVTLSGYVSKYDPQQDDDFPLSAGLLEVVAQPLYTSVNDLGAYTLGEFTPGSYELLVFEPRSGGGSQGLTTLGRYPLEVSPPLSGARTAQRDWIIQPPGDIIGAAKFSDRPIFDGVHGGIGVYVKEIPFQVAVTDRGGRFSLRRVPQGPQTLRFVYPGYAPVEVEVEVVGLATVEATSDGSSVMVDPTELTSSWTHEVEVVVSGLSEDIQGALTLTLSPVFSHITEPVSITLSGERTEGDTLQLRGEVTHQPHDVFHVSVTDRVKRSSVYNIDAPLDSDVRETELYTDGLPDGWEDYTDLREEQLAEQPLDLSRIEPLTEPQQLLEYDLESPLILSGEQGDILYLYSVTSPYETLGEGSLRRSAWRYPLHYKFREIMLALTPSAEITFDSYDTPQENLTEYTLSFGVQSLTARDVIQVAVAGEPCWISSDCEMVTQEVQLSECEGSDQDGRRCEVTVSLDKNYNQIRMWIYDEPRDVGAERSLGPHCYHQCLNNFGIDVEWATQFGLIDYPIPLYSFVARSLATDTEVDCPRDDFKQITETPRPEYCFPELPRFYPISNRDNCLSQPVYGPLGRPLMILEAEVTENLAQDPVSLDVEGFNPLLRYSLVCSFCAGGYWANELNVSLLLTDGVNTYPYEVVLKHEREITTETLPYCWSFEKDPQLSFP